MSNQTEDILSILELVDTKGTAGILPDRILNELAGQFEKDLNLADLFIEIPDASVTGPYWVKLREFFYRNLQEQPEKIRAFLYRADVDEKWVTAAWMTGPDTMSDYLFKAVLMREWQKIRHRLKIQ